MKMLGLPLKGKSKRLELRQPIKYLFSAAPGSWHIASKTPVIFCVGRVERYTFGYL